MGELRLNKDRLVQRLAKDASQKLRARGCAHGCGLFGRREEAVPARLVTSNSARCSLLVRAEAGLGCSSWSVETLKRPLSGSNEALVSVSMYSLKTPPPSIPASSIPCSEMNVICTRDFRRTPSTFSSAYESSKRWSRRMRTPTALACQLISP